MTTAEARVARGRLPWHPGDGGEFVIVGRVAPGDAASSEFGDLIHERGQRGSHCSLMGPSPAGYRA